MRPIRRAARWSCGAAISRCGGAEVGRPEGRCRGAGPGAASCGPAGRLQRPLSPELPWRRLRGPSPAFYLRARRRPRRLYPWAVAGVSPGGDSPRRVSRAQPWWEWGCRGFPFLCLFARQRWHQLLLLLLPPASPACRGLGSIFLPAEPCWAPSRPG